ncbi:uncharacterized protein LOC129229814 [Uloborus diversus]|uniref:uncharacterized protein LOC129229814 n=1 Tax=Uloborus diversus TaxID=327109 RepID=UPI0024094448|nr:uncharacterized protein LOC129229814 [Uloborus diversus]
MKKRLKAKNSNETLLSARNGNIRSDQTLFESAVLELDVLNVPVPDSDNYDSESCFVLPDNNTFERSKETAVEALTEPFNDETDIDIKPTLATDGSIILAPPELPQLTNKSTSIPPKRCGFYKQSVWRRKEPIATARTSSAVETCTAQEDYYKEKLKLEREEHELRKCLLLEKIKFMQNLNNSVEKHPEKNTFYLSESL